MKQNVTDLFFCEKNIKIYYLKKIHKVKVIKTRMLLYTINFLRYKYFIIYIYI